MLNMVMAARLPVDTGKMEDKLVLAAHSWIADTAGMRNRDQTARIALVGSTDQYSAEHIVLAESTDQTLIVLN